MMLEKWLKGSDSESQQKFHDIELKQAELENRLLTGEAELEQIKSILKDTQLSLQLALSSYQGLAEEVSTLYEALRAMMGHSGKHSFSFSFRDGENDNDDDGWN